MMGESVTGRRYRESVRWGNVRWSWNLEGLGEREIIFIGSLEVFFLVKSSRALHRINPDFQRWKPMACSFSRDKKNEHEVFAPRRSRAPGCKKGERSEPPPQIY